MSLELDEVAARISHYSDETDESPVGWDQEGVPFHVEIPYIPGRWFFDMFDEMVNINMINPRLSSIYWWKCVFSEMDDHLFLEAMDCMQPPGVPHWVRVKCTTPSHLVSSLRSHPAMNDDGICYVAKRGEIERTKLEEHLRTCCASRATTPTGTPFHVLCQGGFVYSMLCLPSAATSATTAANVGTTAWPFGV